MATTSEGLQNDTEEFFTPYDEVFDSFDAMGLHENLLKGIYAYGYEKPTAIQQSGIVPFSKGLDVVQHAPSGIGNTATFCLGILQQLDYSIVDHQALILTLTKKLAKQFEKLLRALGKYLDVTVYSCNNRMAVKLHYQRILQKGVHVVVGTPSRVLEMFHRKFLRADIIKMFVLFGADDMLSLGYENQIHDIFKRLPPEIQVGVYSATMSPKALEISRKFMKSSVRILVKGDELTVEGVKQFYVNVERDEWKLETLFDLYETLAVTKIIFFIKSKRRVERLAEIMQERDHSVSCP